MSVAKSVGDEMSVRLGYEVVYSIRFEDFTSEKAIKFSTNASNRTTEMKPYIKFIKRERYSCRSTATYPLNSKIKKQLKWNIEITE